MVTQSEIYEKARKREECVSWREDDLSEKRTWGGGNRKGETENKYTAENQHGLTEERICWRKRREKLRWVEE